jgi:hypothetical protein
MNILLTTACNLDCSYCFAQSLRERPGSQEMKLRELEWLLFDWLNPNVNEARFMGGEPTLHSRYAEALRMALSYGYIVTVFTNGTREALRQTTPDRPYRVLMNLNDWSFYSQGQRNEILNNLSALHEKVSLGYTITRPEFDLSTHRRLIREYGLRPVIRLGLAQPVIGGANAALPDEELAASYASIAEWATRLAADGIRLNFDCGFRRCLLDDSQIEALIRAGTILRFDCSPALDVGPGLQAWRCLAFSAGPGVDLRRFGSLASAQEWFERRDIYLGPERDSYARHQSGWCKGGCLARQMIRATRPEKLAVKI